MIERVLDELAPELEINEAQGDAKEEGSPTPGEEDIKDHATNDDKIIHAPSQQIGIQHDEPERQEDFEVKESAPERGLEEEAILDRR